MLLSAVEERKTASTLLESTRAIALGQVADVAYYIFLLDTGKSLKYYIFMKHLVFSSKLPLLQCLST